MNTVLGDFNAKVVRESYLYPACGCNSLRNETNDARKRMVNLCTGKGLFVEGIWYQY